MNKAFLLCVVALLAVASAGFSQDAKPNFSGKWVLDTGKSDFGALPGPNSRTDVIDHQDPKLKVNSTIKGPQGERVVERSYTTDGKENTNTQGNTEVKSKTRWEGKQLVTELKLEIQGNPVEIKDVWELGEDGKVLTMKRDLKSSQGETSQKLHFDKQ